MPILSSHLPSIHTLCNDLGYKAGQKPNSHYALTVSTKAWRDNYLTNYGISGWDMVDWATEQGNQDILLMAQRFLKSYGAKHWSPGEGNLEYPRDTEQ